MLLLRCPLQERNDLEMEAVGVRLYQLQKILQEQHERLLLLRIERIGLQRRQRVIRALRVEGTKHGCFIPVFEVTSPMALRVPRIKQGCLVWTLHRTLFLPCPLSLPLPLALPFRLRRIASVASSLPSFSPARLHALLTPTLRLRCSLGSPGQPCSMPAVLHRTSAERTRSGWSFGAVRCHAAASAASTEPPRRRGT